MWLKRSLSMVMLVLFAVPVWAANSKPAATITVVDGQFNLLGHNMSGKLNFAFTPDSSNILVSDQDGLSLPMIVRDPRDPVFVAGPEDPFIVWRNQLHAQLMKQTTRSKTSLALELADSLRQAGCTVTRVYDTIIEYAPPGSKEQGPWDIRPVELLTRTQALSQRLEPILKELQSGRAVYLVWSGRVIPMGLAQARQIRTDLQSHLSVSARCNPDMVDLMRRPVDPVTLKQGE